MKEDAFFDGGACLLLRPDPVFGFISSLESRDTPGNESRKFDWITSSFSSEFQAARRREIGLHGFPFVLTFVCRPETILYLQIPFPSARATPSANFGKLFRCKLYFSHSGRV